MTRFICKFYLLLSIVSSILATFICTTNNRTQVLLHDFTYCKQKALRIGVRWQCTQHTSRKCSAFLILDSNSYIIKSNLDHTHSPGRFYKNSDGYYCKL